MSKLKIWLGLCLIFGFSAKPIWAQTPIQIERLGEPRYATPPLHPEDSKLPEESLKRTKLKKSHLRQKRDERFKEKPLSWEQTLSQNMLADSLSERSRLFLFELGTMLPFTVTAGPKSGYTQNLSQEFQVHWRRGGKESDGKSGLFVGVRFAAFSGAGFYQKEPGNFGNLSLGPSIGWGQLAKNPGDLARDAATTGLWQAATGYLWTAGLHMTHRQGTSDTSPRNKDNDFSAEPLLFDAPGLWTEWRLLNVYLGALSLNPFIGAQSGSSLLIFYAGIGIGGWS